MKFASVAALIGAVLLSPSGVLSVQLKAADKHEETEAASRFSRVKAWFTRNQVYPVPSMAQLMTHHGKEPEHLLPIGEGAYQSAKAVEQRTVDSRMACEKSEVYKQSHWEECFKKQGDYVDGPNHGYAKKSAPLQSGASERAPVALGTLVTLLAASHLCQ
eukprot:TRINITY_DN2055_c0_g1_i4.p1 TRINITY_DN2055_c0_g1~~TRINITY_DN2055_c0_g1_i4.p1  ORF type:complete len:160 (-),score=29.55 TRINITY_DN2055_c0_g1_i4:31-510(-)